MLRRLMGVAMSDNSDDVGRWTFIGLCLGAMVFFFANGMQCLPDNCGMFWGGGKGYAEILISLGTLTAAATAGWLAWRSYLMNARGALSARFQKGVELLGQTAYSANVGGINLLVSVMREDPSTYIGPTTKVLLSFGFERSRTFLEGPQAGVWTAEAESSFEAVLGCAAVAYDRRWPAGVDIHDYLRVHNICARRTNVFGVDFRRMAFAMCAWERMAFVECNFERVTMEAAAWGQLVFERCDLRGSQFTILEARRQDSVFFPIELRECQVDETTRINGLVPPPSGLLTYEQPHGRAGGPTHS